MKQKELLTLAQQASYLPERLAGNWQPASGSQSQQMAQIRLQRWCQMATGGDWTRFGERLAWDGIDYAQALQLLTDGELGDWSATTAWTAILAETIDLAETLNPEATTLDLQAMMPLFLLVAQKRLSHDVGPKLAWLAPQAQQALAHSLQQRLSDQIKPTLDHLPLLPSSQGCITLPTLCRAYPVLARQLATSVMQWVDGCTEFLLRLEADWQALGTMLGGGDERGEHRTLVPGVIADLRCDLSDLHAGGRTVWAVTLVTHSERQMTVAYKPKVITLDQAWNNLLTCCNRHGLVPHLDPLWTLPRPTYGWMAWAKSDPTEPSDKAIYYQRIGMILGLLQVLQATDCHAENLMTCGDQLLLVDAEMLRYPQIRGQQWADPLDVVRTGLLPRWRVSQNSVAEMGSLLSTDPAIAEQHHSVANGYGKIMRFLGEHWAEFTDDGGILRAFEEGAVRFAPRPTYAYLRLMEYLRHPSFLQRGVDFSIGVDQLALSYLDHSQHKPLRSLLALEHAALNQGDVPRFSVQIGQPDLGQSLCREAQRGHPAPLPPLVESEEYFVWQPLTLPTPLEQTQQQRLISESLDQRPYLSPVSTSETTFLASALHLGRLLLDRAIPLAEGKLGWIANQRQPHSGLHQYGLIGDDLYSGRAGIALFLAALYAVTQEKLWHSAAWAALAPRPTDEATVIHNTGGRLYTLSVCAKLLNEPDLLRHAVTLSAESAVRAPTTKLDWGVLDGLAGYLLGLLTLYDNLEDPCQQQRVFPLIAGCAEQLFASQADWRDRERTLGGFAHGAAGIAYALVRCAALPGNEHYLPGAQRGWEFQQSLYHEPPGNWQDRRGITPVYLHNWCNGAAGIGLAAAASVSMLPCLSGVVERAATLLLENEEPAPLDTLCCGRFGQIECLLQMGRVMGQQPWIDQALLLAQSQLPRAARSGYFQLYDELPSQHFNPTFFRGVAGIGYTFLRLAAESGEIKQSLPSVLAWAS